MSDEIKTEYNGYPIIYNEGTNSFEAFVDGSKAFEDSSLRNLRVKIDSFEKAQVKKDFKKFSVLTLKFCGYTKPEKYVEEQVTSITEEGHYWIQGEKRHKESVVIPLTASNLEKTQRLVAIREEILKAQEEIKQVESSLDVLKKGERPVEETK